MRFSPRNSPRRRTLPWDVDMILVYRVRRLVAEGVLSGFDFAWFWRKGISDQRCYGCLTKHVWKDDDIWCERCTDLRKKWNAKATRVTMPIHDLLTGRVIGEFGWKMIFQQDFEA